MKESGVILHCGGVGRIDCEWSVSGDVWDKRSGRELSPFGAGEADFLFHDVRKGVLGPSAFGLGRFRIRDRGQLVPPYHPTGGPRPGKELTAGEVSK